MKKIIGTLLVALTAAVTAPSVVPVVAQARTLAQATNDAEYFSSQDCPHHSRGRCGSRAWAITEGVGGGRWKASDQGWECAWYNLTSCTRQSATWYYWRTFWIENDGSRSHLSGFGNDG